jgi:7,8-dihydro-6-hydroxymethylpterin-pyrophosphokinase
MRMEWEGLLQDQVLLKELTMFEHIQRRKRSKRWGEIPVSSQAELKSIALKK